MLHVATVAKSLRQTRPSQLVSAWSRRTGERRGARRLFLCDDDGGDIGDTLL